MAINFLNQLLELVTKRKFFYPLIIITEFFLCQLIIKKIRYTEIDWSTYMKHINEFLKGNFDYSVLNANVEPLVYPSGHVYIFYILNLLTDKGRNIRLAQLIFSFFYLLMISLIGYIYIRINKKNDWFNDRFYFMWICFTSYRIHSIFLLRLFNDCISMIFLYISMIFMINNKWIYFCIIYSMAVSIKMNILLFAPGILFIFLSKFSLRKTVKYLLICAIVQVVLGLPFLLTHPINYIKQSFELTRVFQYKWTVNWRFISEKLFLNNSFHILLLLLHLSTIFLTMTIKWKREFVHKMINDPGQYCCIIFTSNLIGILFSRSLHYQFYLWYYHQLPILVEYAFESFHCKLISLMISEIIWNTYPSTQFSSLCLFLTNLIIIGKLISKSASKQKKDNFLKNKTRKIK